MPPLAVAWKFIAGLPWWAYMAIALFGVHFWLVSDAVSKNDAEWEAKLMVERQAYAAEVKSLQEKQVVIVTKNVVEYRDRVKIVKEKGDEIVKEIAVLAPMDSPVLAGWVRVIHDGAAAGRMPDDPTGAANTAAPVESVALLTAVAENYETCRTEFVKLDSLQKLVRELQAR